MIFALKKMSDTNNVLPDLTLYKNAMKRNSKLKKNKFDMYTRKSTSKQIVLKNLFFNIFNKPMLSLTRVWQRHIINDQNLKKGIKISMFSE